MLPKLKSVYFRSLVILFHKTFHGCFPWSFEFCFKDAFSKYFRARFISVFLYKCSLGLSLANRWCLVTFRLSYAFMLTCVTHQFLPIQCKNVTELPIFHRYFYDTFCSIRDSLYISKAFVCNIFLSASSQNIIRVISC